MYGTANEPGVIPNSMSFLIEHFQTYADFEITASFYEIYNEKVIDLLCESEEKSEAKIGLVKDQEGKMEDRVKNLREGKIESLTHFNDFLKASKKRRRNAATKRSGNSSRSHSIVEISLKYLRGDTKLEPNILFLDLAGCENGNDHLDDANRQQRNTEMAMINKSISSFTTVMNSLKLGSGGTDFRSSKLTHVLKRCFTNSKMLLIATASQEKKFLSTSKETFKLANIAEKIITNSSHPYI